MSAADRILVTLPPSGSARVSSMAAREKLTTPEMAARLLVQAAEKELALPPPLARATGGPPATLDIARILSPEERVRLDRLALSHGTSPEALAAATVRRLLRKRKTPVQAFRLRMPEQAKRKLEEHAGALGCQAGELAAFLFSKRASRPQATLTGG